MYFGARLLARASPGMSSAACLVAQRQLDSGRIEQDVAPDSGRRSRCSRWRSAIGVPSARLSRPASGERQHQPVQHLQLRVSRRRPRLLPGRRQRRIGIGSRPNGVTLLPMRGGQRLAPPGAVVVERRGVSRNTSCRVRSRRGSRPPPADRKLRRQPGAGTPDSMRGPDRGIAPRRACLLRHRAMARRRRSPQVAGLEQEGRGVRLLGVSQPADARRRRRQVAASAEAGVDLTRPLQLREGRGVAVPMPLVGERRRPKGHRRRFGAATRASSISASALSR